MTELEFEQHRKQWQTNWHTHYRLLDIDFETYMVMNGLTEEEFKMLNRPKVVLDKEYVENWIRNLEKLRKKEPISYSSYIEGQLEVLREILKQTQ